MQNAYCVLCILKNTCQKFDSHTFHIIISYRHKLELARAPLNRCSAAPYKMLLKWNKLCEWRHNAPAPLLPRRAPPPPPCRRNVAVLSHAEYVYHADRCRRLTR